MPMHVLGLLLTALSLSGCQLIQDKLDGNQTPVVNYLMPDPSEGEAPLLVSFSWEVADIEDDKLSCTLTYDDGEEQKVENCGEITNAFHTFQKPGGYTVVLNVVDGKSVMTTLPGADATRATPSACYTDAATLALLRRSSPTRSFGLWDKLALAIA